ncbi:MAG TPA: exopolysaccharide biosynthesis protein [Solirubrobacterales bacterium]|nr:exopolysaccharide biosynthesis protein [Solirubrobacterales bacterium]
MDREDDRLSDELERWLNSDADKTLGGLIDLFGPRSFALMFVLLLGVPALPLPTGGATHVFEAIAMLLALQLIANRDRIWLPRRWRDIDVAGPSRRRLTNALMKTVRRLERHSRPRLTFMFGHRLSNVTFGALALGGSLAAFLAPPFSGLDTLPALGVVLLSLGVLLEDFLVVILGVVVGIAGVVLEIAIGRLAIDALGELL